MNWDLLNSKLGAARIGEISLNTLVILLLLGLIIYAFFFILKKYVLPYLTSRKAVKRATYNSFRLEILIWLVYMIFALYNLLSDSLWVSSILISIVLFAGWNFWRDLFAGIIFRLDNKFHEGDPVKYEEHNGLIHEIEKRFLVIKSDKEELVRIPYRKLSSSLLIRKQAKGKLLTSKILIPLAKRNQEEMIKIINDILFECPWTILHEKPQIQLINENQLQVPIYAVDIDSIEKAESFIKKKLADKG